jgi:hypothetical protein
MLYSASQQGRRDQHRVRRNKLENMYVHVYTYRVVSYLIDVVTKIYKLIYKVYIFKNSDRKNMQSIDMFLQQYPQLLRLVSVLYLSPIFSYFRAPSPSPCLTLHLNCTLLHACPSFNALTVAPKILP